MYGGTLSGSQTYRNNQLNKNTQVFVMKIGIIETAKIDFAKTLRFILLRVVVDQQCWATTSSNKTTSKKI